MSNLWMAISPGLHATRVLAMTGPRDTILKACLAPSPAHPRAMATLLEAVALWQGSKVHGALCVAEREWEFDSRLSREAFVDFGGPLYSLDWIAREQRARRRPRDLAGVGEFGDLRRMLRNEAAR